MSAGSLLASLFEIPADQFLAEAWPDRHRFSAGSPERVAEFLARPEFASVDAFIRAHVGACAPQKYLPGGGYEPERIVDAATAAGHFASGILVDLRNINQWFAPAAAWLRRLEADLQLGFVEHNSYCNAFASPAGHDVPKHFDNREVIVVQVLGRKEWRLAPNPALVGPLKPHLAGGEVHALNRSASPEALADTVMPADAHRHMLEPGSALFVPRGWWHATHAPEESLSFSFAFRVPTFAEMFVQTVLQELVREPGWRAIGYDLKTVRPPGTEEFLRALAKALADLRAATPPRRKQS